jgi:dTDP-4-amino-4,6-dideoxygalactose transaminase
MTSFFRRTGRYQLGDFPQTDDVASRTISLPLYEGITDSQQERVVAALTTVIEGRPEASGPPEPAMQA